MRKPRALEITALPVRIAQMLRDEILGGRWKPGQQIIESRYAKELGVGQNAVREALQELEFQGLVRKVPNHGTYVTKLTKEELDQIYEARVELEALAVQWARRRGHPTAEECWQLSAILDRMGAGASSGSFPEFSRADLEFHRALWRLSGNAALAHALEVIAVPQFSFVLIESFHHTALDLMAVVQQHREWLRKITSLTPEEAAAETRRVTKSFWDEVSEARRQDGEDAAAG